MFIQLILFKSDTALIEHSIETNSERIDKTMITMNYHFPTHHSWELRETDKFCGCFMNVAFLLQLQPT